MKKLKRVFSFLLAAIIIIVDPDITDAYSGGHPGPTVTAKYAGDAKAGSRESWGYRMGIVRPYKIKYTNECVYIADGKHSAFDADKAARTCVVDYFKHNIPVLETNACVYTQVHSNQGFKKGEEKWKIVDGKGNSYTGIHISVGGGTDAKLNPYANALFSALKYSGISVNDLFNKKFADIIAFIKKWDKDKHAIDKDTCRSSISKVLNNDQDMNGPLKDWAGTNLLKKSVVHVAVTGQGEKSHNQSSGSFEKVSSTTSSNDTELAKFYTQSVAYLGALLTIYTANTQNPSYNKGCIEEYIAAVSGGKITSHVPVIFVENIQPIISTDMGCYWISPTDHFMMMFGADKEDFMEYSEEFKKHPVNDDGDYLAMLFNIHKYGNKVNHCCKADSGFPKNCYPRWFMKRMNCSKSSADTFWTDGKSAPQASTQAERIKFGKGMYTFMLAGSPPFLQIPETSISYKAHIQFTENGVVDAVKKGYADEYTGIMKDHKNNLRIRIDFKAGGNKDKAEQNRKALLKYLKDAKDNKIEISICTTLAAKYSKNKLSKKNIEFDYLTYKADSAIFDEYISWDSSNYNINGKSVEGAEIDGKVKYKCTNGGTLKDVNGSYITFSMSYADFKKFSKLNDNGVSEGYIAIKGIPISADLSEKRLFDIFATTDVFIGKKVKGSDYHGHFSEKSSIAHVTYKAKTKNPPLDIPITFESSIPEPKAEIKCGTVSDNGADEPFEAMRGFPTTRNLYFASGGNEYVVQMTYEFVKNKNGYRTYTQKSDEARSSLTVPYQKQDGPQDSADHGDAPEPIKVKCPNCGHEVECKWFPVRVAETRWDWKDEVKIDEHVSPKHKCPTGEAAKGHTCPKESEIKDSASTSDNDGSSLNPEVTISCSCGCGAKKTTKQKKVKATAWRWEWRNYGHANDHNTSDEESSSSLPKTKAEDLKSYPIGKEGDGETSTNNAQYWNANSKVKNDTEDVKMPNSTPYGMISHTISWNQGIKDFNYAKITDCKVWKLTEAKVKGTYALTEQDEITAEVQSVDDSHLYNVAKNDTAKDGRLWHDQKPGDQDEYFFDTFDPTGCCEYCVEYEAGKFLKEQNPQDIMNNTTCVSDYLILRTSKGDLSMLYFDYDCKNTTVPVGEVELSDKIDGGSYTIKHDDVKFTDQNERATYKKICTENKMTHYGIDLPDDGITFGGYNGSFDSPYTKYVSTSKFTQNVDIPSLTISKDTYSKYKPTQTPSTTFKLVRNGIDVPDWSVSNGEYYPYDSTVFYELIINDDTTGEKLLADVAQPEYGGKIGDVIKSTYSDSHDKINNVVVHNPVSTKYAKIMPLDSSRDQRTETSKINTPSNEEEEKCSGDPSSCQYSHLHCEYDGNEYHDEKCYEDNENTILGSPNPMDIPSTVSPGQKFVFEYEGEMQSIELPAGAYKLEAWGAQGTGSSGGKGGYSAGTLKVDSTTTLYIGVGGSDTVKTENAQFNGGASGRTAGGGATHFATVDGELSTLASNKDAILLVAGGGGGGTAAYSSGNKNGIGGDGGGANQSGKAGTGSSGSPGKGGTLTAGGAGGNAHGTAGSFGKGGHTYKCEPEGGGGGGGGYYGGGGGGHDHCTPPWDDCGGGGGSGYANKSVLTDISGKTGRNTGKGYALITCISVPVNKSTVADFEFTGVTQKMTLQTGSYKLEVWGAQGGDSHGPGGWGGYSVGTLKVSSATDIYITVGGKGKTFNGGGQGHGDGANGGGASHIALASGELKDLASNKNSILLVAGGGGGAQKYAGGAGGGANQNGVQGSVGQGVAGVLATLSSGYAFGKGGPALAGSDGTYGGAGGGGYYGGGGATADFSLVDDRGGSGGSGYANLSKLTEVSGTSGAREGNGLIRITALSSSKTVKFKELVCTDPHHSANTNWKYYVTGWEKESGGVISGFEKVSGKIRPRGTSTWFNTSTITSDLVLVKAEDEYKLARRSNPYIDLVTGLSHSIDQYSINGTTYKDCIWNLTNTDAASIATKSSKNLNHHYSFGDDVCWDPCGNDNNHKKVGTMPVYPGDTSNSKSQTFLNLDYGFQIYFPNLGDFYGDGKYGVAETSDIEGKGYYGIPSILEGKMDTTEWLRNKYVVFNFDVIYDKNKDGRFEDDTLYLAGEPVPLGYVNPGNKLFVDDQPSSYLYNFYIPMEQDEAYHTSVQFCAVANNAGGDMWGQNNDTQNYTRYDKAALHDAYNIAYTDLVGRIGGLTMVDTGDFRFANTFKQPLSGWLVDNIVHKVNESKQNMFMADPLSVRGVVGSDDKGGLNTYGTQTYKQYTDKLLTFPLVPAKNNIQSLQKQPQRIGYMNYLSVETVGNYYGENSTEALIENGGKYKLQVTPFYYHLDLNTGQWTPVDAYMLVNGTYRRIAEFGSTEATTDYEWFYRLNWQEESARRMYTEAEMDTTNSVLKDYRRNDVDSSDSDTMVQAMLLIPSGKDYIYGTANRMFLKNKNRTFIGSPLTEGKLTNPGERIPESKFRLNAQRWHFHLGLPSSTVFIPKGTHPTQENIANYQNSHSVVVCAVSILASGVQWTLKYDGVPKEQQKIQILPGTKVYDYSEKGDQGPGDKRIVTVYATNHSSKDDLNTKGTH